MVSFEPCKTVNWTIGTGVPTKEVFAASGRMAYINLALLLGGLLLVSGLLYFIVRSVVNPINRISEGLDSGADQVAAAAAEVSSASQSLAEGASEQASGLEETSSSMEEMSSMTKQNSDNASQANMLMGDTCRVVEEANQTMKAMRAAEAAKNTSNLIAGTIKKIKNGSDIVGKTNEAFEKVAGSSNLEQAQGIKQINKAVSEMDRRVQRNAASAEESASAAEEMNAQAEQMKDYVKGLMTVVGGNCFRKSLPNPARKNRGKELPPGKAREIRPERTIPMDELELNCISLKLMALVWNGGFTMNNMVEIGVE